MFILIKSDFKNNLVSLPINFDTVSFWLIETAFLLAIWIPINCFLAFYGRPSEKRIIDHFINILISLKCCINCLQREL